MPTKSQSPGPPPKRVKLESVSPRSPESKEQSNEEINEEDVPEDLSEDHCTICLQEVVDRTMIPVCSHDLFCFDCLMIWTEQSRRCPLCSQSLGDHVIHNIRSRYDYQKHFLPPLRSNSPKPLAPMSSRPSGFNRSERRRRIPREVRERSRREREARDEADRFDRALAKRKWIYRHNLYTKHVASNSYTRYRPYPTPAQFAASPDLIARTISFLRRELQIWVDLDVEFLTTFTISLMKAIDIRSESAVKLLAEFLDMDTPYFEGARHVNAEHFAHEVYSYVRSPYKDLFVYDSVVQYDSPSDGSDLPPRRADKRRGRRESRSRSPSLSPGRGGRRSRSLSWSPSGRTYPSFTSRERALNDRTAFRSRSRPRRTLSPATLPSTTSTTISAISDNDSNALLDRHSVKAEDSVKPMTIAIAITYDKGKGKADRPPSEPNNSLTSNVESDSPASTSASAAPVSHPKRPSRTRNLLDSVHAHLDTKPRVAKPAVMLKIKGQAQGQPSSSTQPSPPSLLSRLSDTYLGEDNAPSVTLLATHTASNDRPFDSRDSLLGLSDENDTTARSELSGSSPLPLTALSGRQDTLFQTAGNSDRHGRKALKGLTDPSTTGNELRGSSEGDESLPRSPSARGPAYALHVESEFTYEQHKNGNGLSSNSRPSFQSDGSHTIVSTVNTRLLRKLEEEKRQHRIGAAPSESHISSAGSTPHTSGDNLVGSSSTVSVDAKDMETRLRARAQLRMRLASEKRSAAVRDGSS